jgi:hypothetical protein
MSFDNAVAALKAAGISAMVYTTPSHSASAPRWRVVAPLYEAQPVAEYERLVSRLNGVLGGALARESWTVTQAYFFGFVKNTPDQDSKILSGDFIDLRADLDAGAIGKPGGDGVVGDGTPKTREELQAHDLESLGRLVDEIKTQSDGYADWIRAGQAIKGAGLPFEVFERYSGKSTLFQDDCELLADKWASFGGNMAGERAVLRLLERHGIDTVAYETAAALAGAQEAFTADTAPPPEPPPPATRKRFQSRQVSQFNLDAAPELIAGWLGQGELAAMIGAPSAGKTAIAAGMAVATATGAPWMGCAIERGATLFLELEGVRGLASRIRAAAIHAGISIENLPIHVIGEGFSFALDADRRELLEAIKSLQESLADPLHLICVDTVARAAAGLDENSASDMAVIVRFCDVLREATGAAVLLLHHTGLGAADRARGSSALRGALDAEILVTRDTATGIGTIVANKMRERDLPRPLTFRIESADIGRGMTGPVAVAADPALGTKKPALGKNTSRVWTMIQGAAPISLTALNQKFRVGWAGGQSESAPRTAVKRALDDLCEQGLILVENGVVSMKAVINQPLRDLIGQRDSPHIFPHISSKDDPHILPHISAHAESAIH